MYPWRLTLIRKSPAFPKTAAFGGSCTLMGEANLAPKARSADRLCTMYEIARHRPCCSATYEFIKPTRSLHPLTRFVLDLKPVAQEVGNKVHTLIGLQYERTEFLATRSSKSLYPSARHISTYLVEFDDLPEENYCERRSTLAHRPLVHVCLPASTIYGTDFLEPGNKLLNADICSWNIQTMPSRMKAKSFVRC